MKYHYNRLLGDCILSWKGIPMSPTHPLIHTLWYHIINICITLLQQVIPRPYEYICHPKDTSISRVWWEGTCGSFIDPSNLAQNQVTTPSVIYITPLLHALINITHTITHPWKYHTLVTHSCQYHILHEALVTYIINTLLLTTLSSHPNTPGMDPSCYNQYRKRPKKTLWEKIFFWQKLTPICRSEPYVN